MGCAKRTKTATIARLTVLQASRPVAEMVFANHRPVKTAFPALRIAAENSQVQRRIVSVAEMAMASILSAAAIAVVHRKVLHAALNHPLLTAVVISFVREQKQVVIAGSIVVHLIQANVIHRHHQVATTMACVSKEKTATPVVMIARVEPAGNLPNDIAAEMASSNLPKETAQSAMETIKAKALRAFS